MGWEHWFGKQEEEKEKHYGAGWLVVAPIIIRMSLEFFSGRPHSKGRKARDGVRTSTIYKFSRVQDPDRCFEHDIVSRIGKERKGKESQRG